MKPETPTLPFALMLLTSVVSKVTTEDLTTLKSTNFGKIPMLADDVVRTQRVHQNAFTPSVFSLLAKGDDSKMFRDSFNPKQDMKHIKLSKRNTKVVDRMPVHWGKRSDPDAYLNVDGAGVINNLPYPSAKSTGDSSMQALLLKSMQPQQYYLCPENNILICSLDYGDYRNVKAPRFLQDKRTLPVTAWLETVLGKSAFSPKSFSKQNGEAGFNAKFPVPSATEWLMTFKDTQHPEPRTIKVSNRSSGGKLKLHSMNDKNLGRAAETMRNAIAGFEKRSRRRTAYATARRNGLRSDVLRYLHLIHSNRVATRPLPLLPTDFRRGNELHAIQSPSYSSGEGEGSFQTDGSISPERNRDEESVTLLIDAIDSRADGTDRSAPSPTDTVTEDEEAFYRTRTSSAAARGRVSRSTPLDRMPKHYGKRGLLPSDEQFS